jgi:hypothetical protein
MTSHFLKNSRAFGVESARIERANKRDLCRAQRDCRRHHINHAVLLNPPRKSVVALTAPARELESRPGDNIKQRQLGTEPLML